MRFKTKSARDTFYNARKNLYSSLSNRSSSGIYINEDITVYHPELFFDTRQLRKHGEIHSVWTNNGNIVLKTYATEKPTVIKTHRDLVEILKGKTSSKQDVTERESE